MYDLTYTILQRDTALHIAVRRSSFDVKQVIRSFDRADEALKVQNIVSPFAKAIICNNPVCIQLVVL